MILMVVIDFYSALDFILLTGVCLWRHLGSGVAQPCLELVQALATLVRRRAAVAQV